MSPRHFPESQNASQEAQNEPQEAGKQLVPPRGHACTTAGPPRVPESSLHHRGATASTGTQLAQQRKAAYTTAARRETPGERAQRASKGLTRSNRKTGCTTTGPTHVPENSLQHRGVTARTGKQLAPRRGHRTYRKTACTTVGPPRVPENSLHHRGPTARTGKQLAPPWGHRKHRNPAGAALKQLVILSPRSVSL